jgi:hypothetical protein
MHVEILNKNQLNLLPFLAKFKREYYMVAVPLSLSTLAIGYPLISIYLKLAILSPKAFFQNLMHLKRCF